MTGALLPNAEQTFLDLNGDPIASGSVYTYEIGTSVMRPTFNDYALTVPNPNPVILDQAGRATMWASNGPFRQVAVDQFGNILWDRETQAYPTTLDYSLTINGNLTVNGILEASTGAFGNLDAVNALVTGNLQVNGQIVTPAGLPANFSSINVTGVANIGTLNATTAAVSGNLNVGGAFGVNGQMYVSGNTTFASTVLFTNPYGIELSGGDIIMDGGAFYLGVGGNLGAFFLGGDAQITGTLTIIGNLLVNGNVAITGALTVNGVPIT